MSKIAWLSGDEAPMMASFSLLPIVQTFCKAADVKVETKDISLSGRIIAQFPERLKPEQRVGDDLAELGDWAKTCDANIIKLPNISAPTAQLISAIKELQGQGYDLPDFPMDPATDEERAIKDRYAKVIGSAVNPVLREGNSDRRAAKAVKAYEQKKAAKRSPPLLAWDPASKTHVSHMEDGDFFSTEKSMTMEKADAITIEFIPCEGEPTVLKKELKLQEGEVIDSAVMSTSKLREFIAKEIADCKEQGILFSLHLKATMMKVSDPIMFGHAVRVYYKSLFDKYGDKLASVGANPNMGVANLIEKLDKLSDEDKKACLDEIDAIYKENPPMAMVDSSKGITNLHSPNDIIIDASMPVVVRDGGKMWTPDDKLHDVKCCIPDRSYATMYKECLEFTKKNGQWDASTMGNVANVGLMAQKAEEYGSHDKTFEMSDAGKVQVKSSTGDVLMEQKVEKGDIFRMCQTKDAPIKDWVKLAVTRSKLTEDPVIFWLDETRAHDKQLIAKVNKYLPNKDEHPGAAIQASIKTPVEAIRESMERAKGGKNTISATGNVLRDYLTDLFPIIELGTSAKMLSIVPLLEGGGLYETGAGGSAPKHVEQLVSKGHLRWDSLGEFLALAVSIEELAMKSKNAKASVLAAALHKANEMFLDNEKNPGRSPGTLPTAGSHFYLNLYWAKALSEQTDDVGLAAKFKGMYDELLVKEDEIVASLKNLKEKAPLDIGGYFRPDPVKATAAMRPVAIYNSILEKYGNMA